MSPDTDPLRHGRFPGFFRLPLHSLGAHVEARGGVPLVRVEDGRWVVLWLPLTGAPGYELETYFSAEDETGQWFDSFTFSWNQEGHWTTTRTWGGRNDEGGVTFTHSGTVTPGAVEDGADEVGRWVDDAGASWQFGPVEREDEAGRWVESIAPAWDSAAGRRINTRKWVRAGDAQ